MESRWVIATANAVDLSTPTAIRPAARAASAAPMPHLWLPQPARVPLGCLNPRELAWKAGESEPTIDTREASRLQGISGPSRESTFCLPCRRSWVRIPSAASEVPANRGFLYPHAREHVRESDTQWTPSANKSDGALSESRFVTWAIALTRTHDLLTRRQTLIGSDLSPCQPRLAAITRPDGPRCTIAHRMRMAILQEKLTGGTRRPFESRGRPAAYAAGDHWGTNNERIPGNRR